MKGAGMKKFIVFAFILQGLIYSQNYNMNIVLKDGTTVRTSVDVIKKIVFGNPTGIKGSSDNGQVIETFKIFQNYPNPFNLSTTIIYQIPGVSKIKVNIYNINGELIKELLNETQNPGEYQLVWDGTDKANKHVASGVYIYSVRSDEQLLSKQMILLK